MQYQQQYPEEAKELQGIISGELPQGWEDNLKPEDKDLATRLHSQTMLNALAPVIPGFWGGSAGEQLHCSISAGSTNLSV